MLLFEKGFFVHDNWNKVNKKNIHSLNSNYFNINKKRKILKLNMFFILNIFNMN